RRPVARLGGRVVQRDVVDLDVAGLAARLLERELGTVDEVGGRGARRALQRHRRVDGDGLAAAATTTAAAAVAAAVVAAAARGYTERERGSNAAGRCDELRFQGTPPRETRIRAAILRAPGSGVQQPSRPVSGRPTRRAPASAATGGGATARDAACYQPGTAAAG